MSISVPKFTDKQGQYLAFIHVYTKLNRRPAAQADIQRYFEVTPPTINSMLVRLEAQGFIRRQPRQARSIAILIETERLPPLR